MNGILDRVWRALGVLPDPNDTSAHAVEQPTHEIPDVTRAQIAHALRAQELAEIARADTVRAPLAGPPLPDHVPIRRAFRPGVTALRCPGCGLVFGDDVMTDCWTCHRPGEPIKETP